MSTVLKFPLEKVSRTSKKTKEPIEAKILLFEGVHHSKPDACLKKAKATHIR